MILFLFWDEKSSIKNIMLARGRLLHCVVICGVEMSERVPMSYNSSRDSPVLLDVHPPDARTPPLIENFCIPNGVETVPFGQESDPEFFTFLLTGVDGTRKFGGSLLFHDPVEGTSTSATKCIAVISDYPMFAAMREIVVYLHDIVRMGRSALPFEAYLDFVTKDIPLPIAGGAMIQVTLRNRCINLKRPALNHLSLLDVPMSILFQYLHLDTLMDVFLHMVLEHKMLLVSSNYSCLGEIMEVLCSLLSPLQWHHVRIPVLPNYPMFAEYLSAPVPYLIGVNISFHVVRHHPSDVTVIDLDAHRVYTASDEDVPQLPKSPRNHLKKRLKELQDKTEKHDGRFVYPTHAVRMAFFKFFADCFYDYRQLATLRDGGDIEFDNEALIAKRPECDRAFYRAATSTQMFHTFILESMNPSGSHKNEILLFDETIAHQRRTHGKAGLLARLAPKRFASDVKDGLDRIQGFFGGDKTAEHQGDLGSMTPRNSKTVVVGEPTAAPDAPGYTYASVPKLNSLSSLNSVGNSPTKQGSFAVHVDNDRSWGRVLRALDELRRFNATEFPSPVSRSPQHVPNGQSVDPKSPKGVAFPTTSMCPRCQAPNPLPPRPNAANVQLRCDQCGLMFVPSVRILSRDEAAEGASLCVWTGYMMPTSTLSKEVGMLMRQGVSPDAELPTNHPAIFWNLVLYLRHGAQPLQYYMPGVPWGEILSK